MTCIRPTLEYSSLALSSLSKTDAARLEKTQHMAARLITGISLTDHISADTLLARAGLEPLLLRQKMGLALMAHRLSQTVPQEPSHLVSVFSTWSSKPALPTSSMSLCSSQSGIRLPRPVPI